MKDASIVFPIYNLVGAQLKGGVIEQDDQCSLESDLAEKYVQEAQTQVSNVHIRTLSYHILLTIPFANQIIRCFIMQEHWPI